MLRVPRTQLIQAYLVKYLVRNAFMEEMTYANAINQALVQAMEHNPNVVTFGLGTNDPKRIFGTTKNLVEKFGPERVFDTPTSENTMTGVQVGLALAGIPSVVAHQRFDFFLLAMDQLVNSAAKWRFMFGGNQTIPITIRLIVGKGWGQGPTHSQSLHAWLSHIPGLKVVAPASPSDAKGLLIAAIEDPNPVVVIEHRWLHGSSGLVDNGYSLTPIGSAKVVTEGEDLTVVTSSYLTAKLLSMKPKLEKYGANFDLIDLRSYSPIDWKTIFSSIEKTGRLIVFDHGHTTGSIAGEIISKVCEERFVFLKNSPIRVAVPDIPEPTSFGLTKEYYVTDLNIAKNIFTAQNLDFPEELVGQLTSNEPHDVPSSDFKGPF